MSTNIDVIIREHQIFRDLLEFLSSYPDFDNGHSYGRDIEAALNGFIPPILSSLSNLQNGNRVKISEKESMQMEIDRLKAENAELKTEIQKGQMIWPM